MNFIFTFVFTILTCTFLQANTPLTISPLNKNAAEVTSSLDLLLDIFYDQDNHLLTLSTQKVLKEVTITIKTRDGQIIYQEEKTKIKNHYLLSINKETPKGIYYLEVEGGNNEIWVQKFEEE